MEDSFVYISTELAKCDHILASFIKQTEENKTWIESKQKLLLEDYNLTIKAVISHESAQKENKEVRPKRQALLNASIKIRQNSQKFSINKENKNVTKYMENICNNTTVLNNLTNIAKKTDSSKILNSTSISNQIPNPDFSGISIVPNESLIKANEIVHFKGVTFQEDITIRNPKKREINITQLVPILKRLPQDNYSFRSPTPLNPLVKEKNKDVIIEKNPNESQTRNMLTRNKAKLMQSQSNLNKPKPNSHNSSKLKSINYKMHDCLRKNEKNDNLVKENLQRKQENNKNKIIDNTKTRMKLTNHKEASNSLIKKRKNLNSNIRVYQKIIKREELNQLRNKVREEIQSKRLLEINKKKNEKSIINSKINNTLKKETTKKIDCHNKKYPVNNTTYLKQNNSIKNKTKNKNEHTILDDDSDCSCQQKSGEALLEQEKKILKSKPDWAKYENRNKAMILQSVVVTKYFQENDLENIYSKLFPGRRIKRDSSLLWD